MAARIEPAGIGVDRPESDTWSGWTEWEPELPDPAGLWSGTSRDAASEEWPDDDIEEYGSAWTGIP